MKAIRVRIGVAVAYIGLAACAFAQWPQNAPIQQYLQRAQMRANAQRAAQSSAPRYYPGQLNLINCHVGQFPASRPQESGGAFLLPSGFPTDRIETVPPPGSNLRRVYDAVGCKYPVRVDQELEQLCGNLHAVSKENIERDVPRIWNKYLIIRERILTHTTSSGVIAHEDCMVILTLNTMDLFLRYFDEKYAERIKVAIEGVEVSLRANRGASTLVRSQAIETFGNLRDPEFQKFMNEHPEFQQMMVDSVMGSLNRNRQLREERYNIINQKLKSTTAPQYQGTSAICPYCGHLASVAGNCPASPDGRHHPGTFGGPNMINSSGEGVRFQ